MTAPTVPSEVPLGLIKFAQEFKRDEAAALKKLAAAMSTALAEAEKRRDALVARLVEALVRHVDWKSRRFPDGKVEIVLEEVRKDADLLVELGRMTKDGDTYRWSTP